MATGICKECRMGYKNGSHAKTAFCSVACRSKNKEWLSRMSNSKKGTPAWNKGKPAPWARFDLLQAPEVREKARLAKIGKPSPFKGKSRPELRGESNGMWKGGIGTERHQAMGKIEYKLWREAIFKRDNWTCQMCKAIGSYLHADHIKSWEDYPELRYAIDNGRTLCSACHYFVTFGREMPKDMKWGVLREVKINV